MRENKIAPLVPEMWAICEVHCDTTVSKKLNCDANVRKKYTCCGEEGGGGGVLLLKSTLPGHDKTFRKPIRWIDVLL